MFRSAHASNRHPGPYSSPSRPWQLYTLQSSGSHPSQTDSVYHIAHQPRHAATHSNQHFELVSTVTCNKSSCALAFIDWSRCLLLLVHPCLSPHLPLELAHYGPSPCTVFTRWNFHTSNINVLEERASHAIVKSRSSVVALSCSSSNDRLARFPQYSCLAEEALHMPDHLSLS